LSDAVFEKTFDLWWPEFEGRAKTIKFDQPTPKKSAKSDDSDEGLNVRISKLESSIDEILYSVRTLRRNKPDQNMMQLRDELDFLVERRLELRNAASHAETPSEREDVMAEIHATEKQIEMNRARLARY
jgi:hypothetical protein